MWETELVELPKGSRTPAPRWHRAAHGSPRDLPLSSHPLPFRPGPQAPRPAHQSIIHCTLILTFEAPKAGLILPFPGAREAESQGSEITCQAHKCWARSACPPATPSPIPPGQGPRRPQAGSPAVQWHCCPLALGPEGGTLGGKKSKWVTCGFC